MGTSHKPAPDSSVVPSKGMGLLMAGTITDVTWRMFVPTIGLLLVGRSFDTKLHTKPWLMLVGSVVGGALSAILVARQIEKIRKSS